jgi:hypothetical protein
VKFRTRFQPQARIVWVVAAATTIQSWLQAIDAQLQGSWPRFWVWILGSGFIGAVAAWAETIKLYGREP